MKPEVCNKIINYLLTQEDWVSYDQLRYAIREQHMDTEKEVLVKMKIIEIDDLKAEHYKIPNEIMEEIKSLSPQFENRWYEYFLDKDRKNKDAELMRKWWESENARIQFEDFPIVKKQANRAILISILTLLAAIVLGVLQIVCNKSS